MIRVISILMAAALAACAPIEKHAQIAQPLGIELRAGIGDTVLHIDKSRNLENAFGAADVYGRQTNEGFVEVRYLGMRDANTAVFLRRDILVQSNETTMSRSGGIFVPNSTTTTYSGSVGTMPVQGTATTTGGGAYLPAPKADTTILSPNSFEIVVDLKKDKRVLIEGRTIQVITASPSEISYRIN